MLNAIAGMNQLEQIKGEMPAVLAMTEFTRGNRYEDFDSKTDHVAEYGLAALVASGVAAKMGLFALLLAFKKFIVIGLIAIGAAFKGFFGRKNNLFSIIFTAKGIAGEAYRIHYLRCSPRQIPLLLPCAMAR